MKKMFLALILLVSPFVCAIAVDWSMFYKPATGEIGGWAFGPAGAAVPPGYVTATFTEMVQRPDITKTLYINNEFVERSKSSIDAATSTLAIPFAVDEWMRARSNLSSAQQINDTTSVVTYQSKLAAAAREVMRLRRLIGR